MKRRIRDWYMHPDLHSLVAKKVEDYPFSHARANEVLMRLRDMEYDAQFSFGTLLGLHRDGCLIPHDSDIDINIYYQGEENFQPLKTQLELSGYECILTDTNQIVFHMEDSVIIDICLFEKQEDGSYLCEHQVKDFHISGKAKEDTETFLEEIYGDWRTPIGKDGDYLK
jgi:hypothetical protein